MGFGKSETPRIVNTASASKSNLERFVLSLDLRNLTFIMHDFGGPVGIGFALQHPDRISRLIATDAPLPLGLPQGELIRTISRSPWFQWINRAYQHGSLEPTLRQLSYNLLSTLWLNGLSAHTTSTLRGCARTALHFPPQRSARARSARHGESDRGRFVLKKARPRLLHNYARTSYSHLGHSQSNPVGKAHTPPL